MFFQLKMLRETSNSGWWSAPIQPVPVVVSNVQVCAHQMLAVLDPLDVGGDVVPIHGEVADSAPYNVGPAD
jgi:hypothetical protein